MKKRILSIILAVVLCFSCVTVSAETVEETSARYLKSLIEVIARYYKYGITEEELYEAVIDYFMAEHPELLEEALVAATDILDDYSTYYNVDELTGFVSNVNQTYVGIGVTVQKSENGCIAIEINKNGGAYEAGMQAGDEIVAINGVSISDKSLNETVEMIQGIADTVVTLDILRGDTHLTLEITRRKINVQTVYYEIIDKVGYIKIDKFAEATSDELKAALHEIEEVNKLSRIIIDVRDNPGGELNSVIDVLSQFVPKDKVLVKFEYKNEKYNYTIESKAEFTRPFNRKIVILANENSASAAELFSGTMQHYKLAEIVGKKTFGKGSMQEMLGIINPPNLQLGDIKLTMAEFTKPNGDKINGVGIYPDYPVNLKTMDFDESTLTPMTISARYTIGDEHSDVLAIEERLDVLGYNVTVDGVFDKLTHQATKNFQAAAGLHPYGVMDYTTQSRLNDVIDNLEVNVDTQLEKAIELLK